MITRRPAPSTLAIAVVMIFFALITWRWSWNQGPPIIRSDAEGYYGYLRALFINNDLGAEAPNGTYLHITPEGTLNKYFAGEAVLLLPFFVAAHGWAHLSGAVPDGLSTPYMRAVGIAGLCYALLGLLAFRALMRRSGVGEPVSAMLLLVLGMGTQLVQYASIQPGWTHVYSFCMIGVFLLLTAILAERPTVGRMIAWGAALGLIVLLRPVNGLVLLGLPVVLGDRTVPFLRSCWLNRRWSVFAIMACMVVVAIQPMLWHAQVGRYVADGYRGEGFHWDRPEVLQVLVGFRRGLFLWTPALFLAALSAVVLFRWDRSRAFGTLVYWVVNTYVIASWWIWYYGSGWGARVYIDHYPVLFLPLALVLQRWMDSDRHRWRVRATGAVLALLSIFTMAQFYQYNHRLLHPEAMDRAKYAYSFLRFDDAHRDLLGGMYRTAPYNPRGLDTLMHEKWDVEGDWSHWWGRRIPMDGAPSPGHVVVCDRVDTWLPAFAMRAHELPKGRAIYLAIGFERYVERKDDTRHVLCITTVEDTAGVKSFYETFQMEPLPPSRDRAWDHIEYRIDVPPVGEGEELKFYFWNTGNRGRFKLDDLDVTVMAVRPY